MSEELKEAPGGKSVDVRDELTKTVGQLTEEVQKARETATTANEETKTELKTRIDELEGRIQVNEEAIKATDAVDLRGVELESTDGKKKGFSFTRAFQLMHGVKQHGVDYGYEEDVFEQSKEMSGVPEGIREKTAINAGSGAAGGFLISTTLHDQVLAEQHEMSLYAKLGINRLTGLTADYSYTLSDGGVTAELVDTDAEASATESVPIYRQFTLQPHVAVAVVPLTWKMLNQPSIAVEADVRRQMAVQHGLLRDTQILTGSGSGQNVKGILGAAATSVNSVDFTGSTLTSGIISTEDMGTFERKLMEMFLKVRISQAMHTSPNIKVLTSPEVRYALSVLKNAEGKPWFAPAFGELWSEYFGAEVMDTTILSAAGNTDENMVVGDWSKTYMGEWAVLGYAVSDTTESNFRKLRTSIRSVEAFDFEPAYEDAFTKAANLDVSGITTVSAV